MKYCGNVGCATTVETSPDVWEEKIVECVCYGDVIKNYRRWDKAEGLNDNLNIDNKISIIMDPFITEHFHHIRYVEWMGTRWKVTGVEVEHPRLVLTIGGVYNGPTPETKNYIV